MKIVKQIEQKKWNHFFLLLRIQFNEYIYFFCYWFNQIYYHFIDE